MDRLVAVNKGLFGQAVRNSARGVKRNGVLNAVKAEVSSGKVAFRAARSARDAGMSAQQARQVGRAAGQKAYAPGEVHKAAYSQDGTNVRTEVRMPVGPYQSKTFTAHSRSGAFAGKTRGVGRHLARDENSSPGKAIVRTPTLRDINGKFAGQGYGVKVFHPSGGRRGNVHTKGLVRITPGATVAHKVSKADDRKGLLASYDLGSMQAHTGARVGRRIPA